MQQHNEI